MSLNVFFKNLIRNIKLATGTIAAMNPELVESKPSIKKLFTVDQLSFIESDKDFSEILTVGHQKTTEALETLVGLRIKFNVYP